MNDDRMLMSRVVKRDERSFAQLVERFGARLFTVARRLLGSREDAEDAVQRAFLRCYTRAADYRPEWAVSTWLYRILTNVCVDEMRRRASRTLGDPAAYLEAASENSRRAAAPPGAYLDLGRALRQVPREARVLLALRYADGLSYDELARVRGISVNTVKSQLSRAKSILRAALGERTGSHDSNPGSPTKRKLTRKEKPDAQRLDG
jgi:RNA polymerase sigma-70 factor (ECF subfamily)